jgi:hypothetical protein
MTDTQVAVPATGSAPNRLRTSAGVVDTSTIVGWGVDADPRNDPTYPYRDRSGAAAACGGWRFAGPSRTGPTGCC